MNIVYKVNSISGLFRSPHLSSLFSHKLEVGGLLPVKRGINLHNKNEFETYSLKLVFLGLAIGIYRDLYP